MELKKRYSEKIEKINEPHVLDRDIKASIIVVTYNPEREEFKKLLDSLDNQTIDEFEMIVIDNSSRWEVGKLLQRYDKVSKYIVMKKNYGPSVGRNLGARTAKGDILIFLDDDGIPRKDFVEEHIQAYKKYDIVALRGKIVPKSDDIFSRLASHYNLGDEPGPFYIDAEGNSSFKKKKLLEIGGFNEELGRGHEGGEISYRLIKSGVPKEKIIYYPNAVIYHDYTSGLIEYIKKKNIRHKKQDDLLLELHPEYFEFEESYHEPERNLNIKAEDEIKVLLINAVSYIVLFLWKNLRDNES